MSTNSHAFWIPTNRLVKTCAESYVEEVDSSPINMPMIVMDSGNREIEQQNAAAMAQLAAQYPHLTLVHLSQAKQQQIIHGILAKADCLALNDLFFAEGVNYGAVMNRMFLISAAMNIDVIHRRDSDTTLQPDCPYPLTLECELQQNDENVIVGSSYVGEWSLDLKPFIKVDPGLFSTFFSSMGVPEKLHASAVKCLDDGAKSYYAGDSLNEANQDGFYYPDAGNFSVKNLHYHFPCLPSDAISADYFVFRMAFSFSQKILFHERRVCHEYHPERRENPTNYVRSLIKFADMRPIYWQLKDEVMAEAAMLESEGTEYRNQYIANLLIEQSQNKIDERVSLVQSNAKNFIARVYPEEAEFIFQESENIVRECNTDYLNHAKILKAWPAIVDAAKQQSIGISTLTE